MDFHLDFVPTPLGHLVPLATAAAVLLVGRKLKATSLGEVASHLTWVIAVCLQVS